MRLEEALVKTLEGAPVQVACRLQWVMNTWAWLMVQPLTVNGAELGAQECLDALFLRYNLDPPDLTKFCY